MKQMIAVSIDVSLIDKARIKDFTRKNGNKAQFLELILIETPGGQFGDFMVKQQVTKEEREARKEMPILGNGKIIGGGGKQYGEHSQAKANGYQPQRNDDSDIPF